MSAASVPLWREVWFKAKREKARLVATVLMADDSIRKVEFGPRGGWRFVE